MKKILAVVIIALVFLSNTVSACEDHDDCAPGYRCRADRCVKHSHHTKKHEDITTEKGRCDNTNWLCSWDGRCGMGEWCDRPGLDMGTCRCLPRPSNFHFLE